MTQPQTLAPITAAHVAVALVAACRQAGLDPAQAFGDVRGAVKARIVAAAGCVARLGWSKQAAGRAFKIEPMRLAPSNLAFSKIGTNELLMIADALKAAGMTAAADSNAGSRFRQPYAVEAKAVRAREKTKPAPGPRASSKAVLRAVPAVEAKIAAIRPEARKPSAPRRIGAAAEPLTPAGHRRAEQVRAISERGLVFIRRFLDSGAWSVGEVADLFDTHPDAIADALTGPIGVAA